MKKLKKFKVDWVLVRIILAFATIYSLAFGPMILMAMWKS